MAWLYLFIAALFECGWAIGLKHTEGFTKLTPSLLTVSAMIISFWLLSIAMKTIQIGTAYAVWAGTGAVGVAILGMFIFGESRDIIRVLCLLLIVTGIVGLKFISSTSYLLFSMSIIHLKRAGINGNTSKKISQLE